MKCKNIFINDTNNNRDCAVQATGNDDHTYFEDCCLKAALAQWR